MYFFTCIDNKYTLNLILIVIFYMLQMSVTIGLCFFLLGFGTSGTTNLQPTLHLSKGDLIHAYCQLVSGTDFYRTFQLDQFCDLYVKKYQTKVGKTILQKSRL